MRDMTRVRFKKTAHAAAAFIFSLVLLFSSTVGGFVLSAEAALWSRNQFFWVYVQAEGSDQREPALILSQAEFEGMKSDGEPVNALYFSDRVWKVSTSAEYVTLTDIIARAGLVDVWKSGASISYGGDPIQGKAVASYTYDQVQEMNKFYPDAAGPYSYECDPEYAPFVFSIWEYSDSTSVDHPAYDVSYQNYLMANQKYEPRVLFGVSEDAYFNRSADGTRLWQATHDVTITAPASFFGTGDSSDDGTGTGNDGAAQGQGDSQGTASDPADSGDTQETPANTDTNNGNGQGTNSDNSGSSSGDVSSKASTGGAEGDTSTSSKTGSSSSGKNGSDSSSGGTAGNAGSTSTAGSNGESGSTGKAGGTAGSTKSESAADKGSGNSVNIVINTNTNSTSSTSGAGEPGSALDNAATTSGNDAAGNSAMVAGQTLSGGSGATKATYTVSKPYGAKKGYGELVYKRAMVKKAASKATVPETAEIDGLEYRVVGIANKAFGDLPKLKTVKVGKYVKKVGKWAFKNSKNVTKLSGFAGVTELGRSAFYGLKKVKKVPSMPKLKTIGAYAFRSCTALKSYTVGKKVTSIGLRAFKSSGVTKLTVKSKKLKTKKSVSKCLSKSKVKTVKLSGLGSSKSKVKKAFKKYSKPVKKVTYK